MSENPFRRGLVHRLLDKIRKGWIQVVLELEDRVGGAAHKIRSFSLGSRRFRKIKERLAGLWEATHQALFNSRLMRGTAKGGRAARHGWLVFWDELRLKMSQSVLMAPVRGMVRWRQKWQIFWDELRLRISTSQRLTWMVGPLRVVYRTGLAIWDFAVAWLWTRPYRTLWLGIPAFSLMMLVCVCVARMSLYSDFERAKHYRVAAYEALQQDEFERVDLYYRKLAQLGQETPAQLFEKGIRETEAENYDEAFRLMKQLAPDDEEGFPAAHLWIGSAVIQELVDVPVDGRFELLEHHLSIAHRRLPNRFYAAQLLAATYDANGKRDQGLALLQEFPDQDLPPADLVILADMLRRMGDRSKAQTIARRVDDHYRRRVESEPITVQDYELWCTAHEFNGQHLAVLKTLAAGYSELKDETLRTKLQNSSMAYLRLLRRGGTSTFPAWRGLAQYMLESPHVTDRIQSLIAARLKDKRVSEQVDQLLAPYVADGKLSTRAHAIVADWILESGDHQRARVEYARILKRNSKHAASANNLAWLYHEFEPVDLTRALKFANYAVKLEPTNPAIRETRGRILFALEQWNDAAHDLELAVNGLPRLSSIHAKLARCYDELGEPQLADAHRQRIQ